MAQQQGYAYYEVDLESGVNATEVVLSMFREIQRREPSLVKEIRLQCLRETLRDDFSCQHFPPIVGFCLMWVAGLSGVLSVYLMASFAIGLELSFGWQVGLYILSIFIAPVIWFLYLRLTKWLASYIHHSLIMGLGVFLFAAVLAGALLIAVPIWRAAVDPSERDMIGFHYAAYAALSPLLYLIVTTVRILCFRPRSFDFV